MIRILVKYPDGAWCTHRSEMYSNDAEKQYAKVLVGLYRDMLDKGIILFFTVEIQNTVKNRKFVQVIGSGGVRQDEKGLI